MLEAHGIELVFGLPGTQNIALHEELRRRGRMRVVATTHELAAAFMAIGYYRASGRLAPLLTIPGPGFTYALTGLAEALHDSAALLHIVGPHAGTDTRRGFQALDHIAIATPLVKSALRAGSAAEVAPVLTRALELALRGEPGPVLVEWTCEAFERRAAETLPSAQPAAELPATAEVAQRLARAHRPLLYLGQGGIGAAQPLRELAEWLGAPVVTTLSGRGVIAEDHPLVVAHDVGCGGLAELNRLLRRSDAVLAVGCRLGASGTADFRMHLPPERVVHVDASGRPPGAKVARSLVAPAETFVPALLESLRSLGRPHSAWPAGEIARARTQVRVDAGPEPAVHGASPPTAAAFFAALRGVLPRDGIVVADSGTHQMLLRRHYEVLSPRGLMVPSDFQSMGFAVPAAIGAKLAAPERQVVAVVGDGGFAISGLELLTAAREGLALTVVVFADRYLNKIRLEQLARYGQAAATAIENPDFEALARAVRARYFRCDANAPEVLGEAVRSRELSLVEVPIGDSAAIHNSRLRGLALGTARRTLHPAVLDVLRRPPATAPESDEPRH